MYETLYHYLPKYAQNIALSSKGYFINKSRYDELFYEAYSELKSNTFSHEMDLKNYQEAKFAGFLEKITENSLSLQRFEYLYGKVDGFSTISDLNNLPITTKADIQRCLKLLPGKVNKDDIISHTSGTTGSGLVYPVTKRADAFQWAVWWRYRNAHGINFDTRCGYFGGRSIVSNRENSCFYRYNSSANQLMLSAYHLNAVNLKSYVSGILRYDVRWLHGYPSFISYFASLCLEGGIDISEKIDVVTIGSESLMPSQEAIIKKAFKCNIFQHYGLSEGVVNISQNNDSELLVDEDFSLVEFGKLNDSNFRVIGTSFYNTSTPFLKYDTGDVATLKFDRGYIRKVQSIDGRKEDAIELSDGTRIGRLDHVFKDIYQVKEVQIQQKSLSHLHILLVKGIDFDSTVVEKIRSGLDSRLPLKLELTFEYVDLIPRTTSGKLRFVISFLR